MVRDGVKVYGRWIRASLYVQAGPGALCMACSEWGHIEERFTFPGMARCAWCSGKHRTKFHKCEVSGCQRPQGTPCPYTIFRCPNCKGPHSAVSRDCPIKKSVMEEAKRVREEGQFGEEIAKLGRLEKGVEEREEDEEVRHQRGPSQPHLSTAPYWPPPLPPTPRPPPSVPSETQTLILPPPWAAEPRSPPPLPLLPPLLPLPPPPPPPPPLRTDADGDSIIMDQRGPVNREKTESSLRIMKGKIAKSNKERARKIQKPLEKQMEIIAGE